MTYALAQSCDCPPAWSAIRLALCQFLALELISVTHISVHPLTKSTMPR